MVAGIAGVEIVKKHIPGPQGVRGRNSDNSRLRQVLGWEPEISLEEGMTRTYVWVEEQVRHAMDEAQHEEATTETISRLKSSVYTSAGGVRR